MKDKYSNAGKGDKSRVSDKKRFDKNWDKIFGSINEKKTKKIKNSWFYRIHFIAYNHTNSFNLNE